jgi:hypothetical protein
MNICTHYFFWTGLTKLDRCLFLTLFFCWSYTIDAIELFDIFILIFLIHYLLCIEVFVFVIVTIDKIGILSMVTIRDELIQPNIKCDELIPIFFVGGISMREMRIII